MRSFAENLSDLIHNRKETQSAFAKITGYDRQNINYYCKGRYFPKEDFFLKLYDLGINLNWLFTGEGEIYRQMKPTSNVSEVVVGETRFVETVQSKLLKENENDIKNNLLKKLTVEEYIEIMNR
ncbi:MAG: helix-turn-helix transcriptional regulator [Candidatus Kapabacteria bacterium]|nr:helix-turn-helix transcriptional regulator [Candidatus Kapabacteria bacterium]